MKESFCAKAVSPTDYDLRFLIQGYRLLSVILLSGSTSSAAFDLSSSLRP